jgi:hypothetical protein
MNGIVFAVAAGGLLGAGLLRSALRHRNEVMRSRSLVPYALRVAGITPADADAAGLDAELQAAHDSCTRCSVSAQCRRSMARSIGARVPESCPNRPLMQSIARHRELVARDEAAGGTAGIRESDLWLEFACGLPLTAPSHPSGR